MSNPAIKSTTVNVQVLLADLIEHRGPGLYELTCDVPNPQPDGRSPRDFWLRATWEKGMRFVVERRIATDQYEKGGLYIRKPSDSYGYAMVGNIDPREDPQAARIAAIVPHLRRVMPKDVFDLQALHGASDREALWCLEYLVRTGAVPLSVVAAAMDEHRRTGDHWRAAFPEDYTEDEPAHGSLAR